MRLFKLITVFLILIKTEELTLATTFSEEIIKGIVINWIKYEVVQKSMVRILRSKYVLDIVDFSHEKENYQEKTATYLINIILKFQRYAFFENLEFKIDITDKNIAPIYNKLITKFIDDFIKLTKIACSQAQWILVPFQNDEFILSFYNRCTDFYMDYFFLSDKSDFHFLKIFRLLISFENKLFRNKELLFLNTKNTQSHYYIDICNFKINECIKNTSVKSLVMVTSPEIHLIHDIFQTICPQKIYSEFKNSKIENFSAWIIEMTKKYFEKIHFVKFDFSPSKINLKIEILNLNVVSLYGSKITTIFYNFLLDLLNLDSSINEYKVKIDLNSINLFNCEKKLLGFQQQLECIYKRRYNHCEIKFTNCNFLTAEYYYNIKGMQYIDSSCIFTVIYYEFAPIYDSSLINTFPDKYPFNDSDQMYIFLKNSFLPALIGVIGFMNDLTCDKLQLMMKSIKKPDNTQRSLQYFLEMTYESILHDALVVNSEKDIFGSSIFGLFKLNFLLSKNYTIHDLIKILIKNDFKESCKITDIKDVDKAMKISFSFLFQRLIFLISEGFTSIEDLISKLRDYGNVKISEFEIFHNKFKEDFSKSIKNDFFFENIYDLLSLEVHLLKTSISNKPSDSRKLKNSKDTNLKKKKDSMSSRDSKNNLDKISKSSGKKSCTESPEQGFCFTSNDIEEITNTDQVAKTILGYFVFINQDPMKEKLTFAQQTDDLDSIVQYIESHQEQSEIIATHEKKKPRKNKKRSKKHKVVAENNIINSEENEHPDISTDTLKMEIQRTHIHDVFNKDVNSTKRESRPKKISCVKKEGDSSFSSKKTILADVAEFSSKNKPCENVASEANSMRLTENPEEFIDNSNTEIESVSISESVPIRPSKNLKKHRSKSLINFMSADKKNIVSSMKILRDVKKNDALNVKNHKDELTISTTSLNKSEQEKTFPDEDLENCKNDIPIEETSSFKITHNQNLTTNDMENDECNSRHILRLSEINGSVNNSNCEKKLDSALCHAFTQTDSEFSETHMSPQTIIVEELSSEKPTEIILTKDITFTVEEESNVHIDPKLEEGDILFGDFPNDVSKIVFDESQTNAFSKSLNVYPETRSSDQIEISISTKNQTKQNVNEDEDISRKDEIYSTNNDSKNFISYSRKENLESFGVNPQSQVIVTDSATEETTISEGNPSINVAGLIQDHETASGLYTSEDKISESRSYEKQMYETVSNYEERSEVACSLRITEIIDDRRSPVPGSNLTDYTPYYVEEPDDQNNNIYMIESNRSVTAEHFYQTEPVYSEQCHETHTNYPYEYLYSQYIPETHVTDIHTHIEPIFVSIPVPCVNFLYVPPFLSNQSLQYSTTYTHHSQ